MRLSVTFILLARMTVGMVMSTHDVRSASETHHKGEQYTPNQEISYRFHLTSRLSAVIVKLIKSRLSPS